jgi:glycine betaine/choline ABC-type transport system substrate-binding protein
MPLLLIAMGLLSYLTNPFKDDSASAVGGHGTITVGSKNFTEQLILGELMAQMLEAHTNLKVNRRFNLGGTMICHGALVNGEIDLYAEYTGSGLTAILKEPAIADPDKAFQHVAEMYLQRFDVEWLDPFGFNNTYAITVRTEDAEHFGWQRISDLETRAPMLKAGFTAEFAERPDGYPGVSETYGFRFGDIKDLDPSLMYEAVSKGEVDVICAFATDGRIAAYHLTPLKDNLKFFPPYYAAPVIRKEILRRYPEVKAVLSRLKGVLDTADMQRLNFEVDGKKRNVGRVVEEFLKQEGLI